MLHLFRSNLKIFAFLGWQVQLNDIVLWGDMSVPYTTIQAAAACAVTLSALGFAYFKVVA
jgi:hypothetical protein